MKRCLVIAFIVFGLGTGLLAALLPDVRAVFAQGAETFTRFRLGDATVGANLAAVDSSGRLSIKSSTGISATQVQGTADDGVAEVGNPVQIGGVDGGGLVQAVSVDTAGRVDINPISGQTGIAGGTGVDGATVPRVSLATNVALPAGTNIIGALSANQSINISQINGVTPLMGNGVTGTGSPRVTIASDNTAFAVNNTQQGTAAQNVTQFGGNAIATGTGAGGVGIPRVTLSNDSSLAANQSVNTAQINGVAPTMGNGVSGTGVQRVTLASDSTGQVALAAGAATIGSLAANQSVNVAQVNGVATSTGVGASGTGVQRVVTATNDPCQSSGVTKSSVALNVTASAQVIAASGSTIIYVCGFNASLSGTTPTMQFQYGTGAVCATGLTNVSGIYAPTAGSMLTYGPGSTVFATTASQALCIATTGTGPSVQGVLTYVQQ